VRVYTETLVIGLSKIFLEEVHQGIAITSETKQGIRHLFREEKESYIN
jgi:hypothetical protein